MLSCLLRQLHRSYVRLRSLLCLWLCLLLYLLLCLLLCMLLCLLL